MGCDTVFRRPVHLVGPDLDLKGLSRTADQGRMQGLVHIRLRHGDIILEPSGDGLIQLMDHAQSRVAVLHRVHDDPHREQIVDLIQGLILVHHLLIDAEEMLHPPVYLGFDPGLPHVGRHLVYDALDERLPGFLPQGDLLGQVIVDLGL